MASAQGKGGVEENPKKEQKQQDKPKEQTNGEKEKDTTNGPAAACPRHGRHPLENVWTLWYLENDRSKHWKDMLTEVAKIDSVETFWSLYYTIRPPSELKVGCDYSMFKLGIKPMWEDDANSKGGRWLISVNKNSKAELDRLWLEILLMMTARIFDNSEEICGAVINIRSKNNKISVWTANGCNEAAILEIGQKLKLFLRLQSNNLQYQLHSDAMCKSNSSVKSIYTV
ncbi:eukaryotic translation initiation factor 4E1 [Drosophila miranda]|uniref:eukaryotic translation initiation factor 4E1 n=1 Tax=Drosophila miranda TaxID=7229 RepID=UPI0007E828E0|nr:eukaryotic translation initiation factor 4E1 [Drosophila miranda]